MKEGAPLYEWRCKKFEELSNHELYAILQLRSKIFVVEQNCPYQDCDGKDFDAYHLFALSGQKVIAYSRLLDKGMSYPDAVSIGRVVVDNDFRNKGLGSDLMTSSIDCVIRLFGKMPIKISAQLHLLKFYESLGFVSSGESYLEDNIPHILMERNFSVS